MTYLYSKQPQQKLHKWCLHFLLYLYIPNPPFSLGYYHAALIYLNHSCCRMIVPMFWLCL